MLADISMITPATPLQIGKPLADYDTYNYIARESVGESEDDVLTREFWWPLYRLFVGANQTVIVTEAQGKWKQKVLAIDLGIDGLTVNLISEAGYVVGETMALPSVTNQ